MAVHTLAYPNAALRGQLVEDQGGAVPSPAPAPAAAPSPQPAAASPPPPATPQTGPQVRGAACCSWWPACLLVCRPRAHMLRLVTPTTCIHAMPARCVACLWGVLLPPGAPQSCIAAVPNIPCQGMLRATHPSPMSVHPPGDPPAADCVHGADAALGPRWRHHRQLHSLPVGRGLPLGAGPEEHCGPDHGGWLGKVARVGLGG